MKETLVYDHAQLYLREPQESKSRYFQELLLIYGKEHVSAVIGMINELNRENKASHEQKSRGVRI